MVWKGKVFADGQCECWEEIDITKVWAIVPWYRVDTGISIREGDIPTWKDCMEKEIWSTQDNVNFLLEEADGLEKEAQNKRQQATLMKSDISKAGKWWQIKKWEWIRIKLVNSDDNIGVVWEYDEVQAIWNDTFILKDWDNIVVKDVLLENAKKVVSFTYPEWEEFINSNIIEILKKVYYDCNNKGGYFFYDSSIWKFTLLNPENKLRTLYDEDWELFEIDGTTNFYDSSILKYKWYIIVKMNAFNGLTILLDKKWNKYHFNSNLKMSSAFGQFIDVLINNQLSIKMENIKEVSVSYSNNWYKFIISTDTDYLYINEQWEIYMVDDQKTHTISKRYIYFNEKWKRQVNCITWDEFAKKQNEK